MRAILHYRDYRFFPYERRLARREVEQVMNATVLEDGGALVVDAHPASIARVHQLTYFSRAEIDGRQIVPSQVRLEESAGAPSRRQQTRYSLHRLHDYKGRFNPQTAKVLGNIGGLSPGSFVFDPFCGSGTVLLEGVHNGWNAAGLDSNPLACLIARTKISLFYGADESVEVLSRTADVLRRFVSRIDNWDGPFGESERRVLGATSQGTSLPSRAYLESWFPSDVLLQLEAVMGLADTTTSGAHRDAIRLCVSNVLREVGWQDPGDLRVRRRKDTRSNYPAIPLILAEIERLSAGIASIPRDAISEVTSTRTIQSVTTGDSRSLDDVRAATAVVRSGPVDAIITSPPYATALPYIDTQRFSLVTLGLAPAASIRNLERLMIGDRDVGTTERRRLERSIEMNPDGLPDSLTDFLQGLLASTSESKSAGFRRKNNPALLYRYFTAMKRVLANCAAVLPPGRPMFLVVGPSHTRIDGARIDVPTPKLIAEIAASQSFLVRDVEPLEAYARYSLHKANAIQSEALVCLERA